MILENSNFNEIDLHFFSKMVHNIHINEGNEVVFIHFIGYHMANSAYENWFYQWPGMLVQWSGLLVQWSGSNFVIRK